MEDRWLSITEICKYLGVSNDTVYKWIDKHGMPAHRMGRPWKFKKDQACLRPRDRFWGIPVPKIDSAFDNLFVPQPSWAPSTTQQLRKLVAAPYLAPI